MKWIKVAIGAVIAVSVVPLVILSFINTKNSLEAEKIIITTEVIYDNSSGGYHNYSETNSQMDNISYYFNNDYDITNLKLTFNTNVVNIPIIDYYQDKLEPLIITIDNNSLEFIFSVYGIYFSDTYDSIYSVNKESLTSIDITFTKPNNIKNSNIITMILSLAPIIFVGGVLFYFFKPFKRRD